MAYADDNPGKVVRIATSILVFGLGLLVSGGTQDLAQILGVGAQ